MTTISADIIADSVSEAGVRITTLHLRYPRIIHSEVLTHRVFSRNARSSRAVPVERMIREIETDPVVPLFWGKNQKGMQASEECDAWIDWRGGIPAEEAWLCARDAAVDMAHRFADAGYHKQVVNRLLEPFMHIDTLVTSTEWDNFFELRDHPDAEPHFQMLARAIRDRMAASRPDTLSRQQWHLPYIRARDIAPIMEFVAPRYGYSTTAVAIAVSAARCARISYAPFDGNDTIEKEIDRFDRLVGARPLHASPCEHQALPDPGPTFPELHGNFRGWIQHRKYLERT